jgi:hypothetical protein
MVDLGPGPFFFGWIAFQNFLLADLDLGEKKLEAKKKLRSKLRKRVPTSEHPPTQPSIDFDSIDARCFSEQSCEQ